MTLREKQSLFVRNVAKLINFASQQGWDLTFGETYRTEEQQEIYLARGLSDIQRSRHQDRLAIDLNLFVAGVYMTDSHAYSPLGSFWKNLHPACKWGGDFPHLRDGNHFEMEP